MPASPRPHYLGRERKLSCTEGAALCPGLQNQRLYRNNVWHKRPKQNARTYIMLGEKGHKRQCALQRKSHRETVVRGVGVTCERANGINYLNIKCITYNVEAMSMDRLRQITTELRKSNYDVAMIQRTRWNLTGSMWSNGYKVYNAPAAKTSTEARAGVSFIVNQKLLSSTRGTQHTNL